MNPSWRNRTSGRINNIGTRLSVLSFFFSWFLHKFIYNIESVGWWSFLVFFSLSLSPFIRVYHARCLHCLSFNSIGEFNPPPPLFSLSLSGSLLYFSSFSPSPPSLSLVFYNYVCLSVANRRSQTRFFIIICQQIVRRVNTFWPPPRLPQAPRADSAGKKIR